MTHNQKLAKSLVEHCGSQNKAAEAIHVTSGAIRLWLDGLRRPKPENLFKIAAILDGDNYEIRQARIDSYSRQLEETGEINYAKMDKTTL